MPAPDETIQSVALRRDTGPVLDQVEHHGQVIEVKRYKRTSAYLVPPGWFEEAAALMAARSNSQGPGL